MVSNLLAATNAACHSATKAALLSTSKYIQEKNPSAVINVKKHVEAEVP